MEWCWGWDLDRTFSNVCPHTESLVLLTLLSSAGGGAGLLKGPQPPCGPQPDALSLGRLLSLLPQRVGAILPGVYHHSFSPVPSPLPFLPSPSCSRDPPTLSGSKLIIQQKFKVKVQSGVIESSGSGARLPGFQSQFQSRLCDLG